MMGDKLTMSRVASTPRVPPSRTKIDSPGEQHTTLVLLVAINQGLNLAQPNGYSSNSRTATGPKSSNGPRTCTKPLCQRDGPHAGLAMVSHPPVMSHSRRRPAASQRPT
jgi:hypothetical protein